MERKLGRGLAALFGDLDKPNNTLYIDTIKSDWNQNLDSQFNELIESIKTYGVLQPIIVREINNKQYEVIIGKKRLRSAKCAGLTKIPAIVIQADDKKAKVLSLIENMQRNNINLIEEANLVNSLMNLYNYSDVQISKILCKNIEYINKLIKILTLPSEIKDSIKNLTLNEAYNFINSQVNNNKQFEDNENINSGTPIIPPENEEAIELANRITKILNIQTKIVINQNSGQLILTCRTYEELELVINKLTASK